MNEYLKDGLESLQDISEGAVPPEVYYLSAKAILEHINNLQSKIDKAYDYLDKFIPNEWGVLLTERQWNYIKSILKEDNNE